MPEKPILFSGPMVRAILDGRKTQTRRVVNPQPFNGLGYMMGREKKYIIQCGEDWPDDERDRAKVPYQVGDTLWVREICYPYIESIYTHDEVIKTDKAVYRADGTTLVNGAKWKPSIFMPRWAARITLEVADVRVQRVQDISEEDAIAEGTQEPSLRDLGGPLAQAAWCERQAYQRLWDHLNLKRGYGWEANPWVFAYTFRKVEQ